MNIAILDLGTNTFHLLIANVAENNSWTKIHSERVTVKLGEGGIDKKIIALVAYRRGMNALKKFRNSLNRFQPDMVSVYGTAALRNALNGQQFILEARGKYNFDIQLISGEEEATFIYYGVRQAVPLKATKSLIMDIGGGSVEFIIADELNIFWKKSFKLGAALLQEKFKPHDPLNITDIESISTFLSHELKPLFDALKLHQPRQLIGSAGSFETFASMIHHKFPASGSHYGKTTHPIQIHHFRQLHSELIVSSNLDRNSMKGLLKMRVDMIVMASLLLNFVLDHSAVSQIKLSAYALKEGALWKVIKEMNS